jgi:CRISPR-associated endonuclease/helicase Cas3
MDRLRENRAILDAIRPDIPSEIEGIPLPRLPGFLDLGALRDHMDPERMRRRCELWTRFLFSALVDADRLDSEEFGSPRRASLRVRMADVAELRCRLDDHLEAFIAELPAALRQSAVNRARAEVLDACRRAASEPPGFFSLTVPTGGGKTLASLAFALKHAEVHDLRRVFIVIPYTSIIEQSAAAYRKALGDKSVLEHHSNLDPEAQRTLLGVDGATKQDLAAENWDAQLVVTTSVQFFETLFSNRPSRCRRLHRVARSVIVLDEVQTLPPGLLLCILEVLRDLVECYGCSVVFSTATPPALARRESLVQGIERIFPIIPDPEGLSRSLTRVEYVLPTREAPSVTWEGLARELASHEGALAIVHRRADARALAAALGSELPGRRVFHLSALMCPAHRSAIIAEVKKTLAAGRPCHAVATQLVEAGVDLDFPVVYRALGGLDSLVQAAGRCNREGKLAKGRVVVFRAPTLPPRGVPCQALQVAETMLASGELDLGDPGVFERYFRMLYMGQHLDARGIQPLRANLAFASVGDRFEMIEDGFSRTIIVPYGDSAARVERLRHEGPSREVLRGLQPFGVSVYMDSFDRLSKAGALEEVAGCATAMTAPFVHLYDANFGLVMGDELAPDPEKLIV